ncbi:MAG: (d)CMP kinase [Desulfobacterales bacterium]|nr:(d)CMP kinase [Desulfobacterales bacterium]
MKKIIAIDGPAGSGKSTVSRLTAKRLHFLYLDTGAMYRAVALESKRRAIDLGRRKELRELCRNLDLHFRGDEEERRVCIGPEDISSLIRSPEMDMLSSRISAIGEVREAMTELQRKIGVKGGVVAEGRDMGTVVFPQADHKFFITATLEVRAERRYRERLTRGESVSKAEVERELRERDEQDTTRAIAPLFPAKDAVIIDTTDLSPDQVVQTILAKVKDGKLPGGSGIKALVGSEMPDLKGARNDD